MRSSSLHLRYGVAAAVAVVLVAGCSSSAPGKASGPATTAAATSSAQQYLTRVNALCDALLPDVLDATHGGSIDIPAAHYLRDWPAHHALLVGFDKALAAVPVPAAAAGAAAVLHAYVTYADSLDAARLRAANHGETAWRREVAAETGAANDPTIAALTAAGFAQSCEAR